MKKNFLKTFLITGIVIATLSSCTTFNHSMREPNTRVNLNKSDFTLSDQVTASATSTKIFFIDFERLFTKKTGVVEHDAPATNINITYANIPVVGNLISDKTANYSLYELMTSNPGYDVVFYPQYETKIVRPVGIGFIVKVTTVKTTARLGKLNK
jgi:spermidine/putrescine-binding protein